MVLKQEGVREISKGIKKFQGFRDENCGILQSTSSGGRELKDIWRGLRSCYLLSTSSRGRELKGYQSGDGYERHVVDLLGRSGIEMDYSLFLYSNHPTSRPARDV